jgi:hypothetical protein
VRDHCRELAHGRELLAAQQLLLRVAQLVVAAPQLERAAGQRVGRTHEALEQHVAHGQSEQQVAVLEQIDRAHGREAHDQIVKGGEQQDHAAEQHDAQVSVVRGAERDLRARVAQPEGRDGERDPAQNGQVR